MIEATGVTMQEILFIGDKMEEGGIDSIAVERWEDTALVIETLNKVA